ncbi:MAG: endolytic transglycosylase MltG [Lachnospiraceae bacterium]|nr:endolytic transglycosylase MltG [Lachnospiraceae bacterium]
MSKKYRNGSSPLRTVTKFFVYSVAVVILIYCSMAAFHLGTEIFSKEGVEEFPGTDMTIEVASGTTMKSLGEELEEDGIVRNSIVFYIQSVVYEIKTVQPGTYKFNTSDSGDKILQTIAAGPIPAEEEVPEDGVDTEQSNQ